MPRSNDPDLRRPEISRVSRRPERIHERDLLHVCGLAAVQALLARHPHRIERLFFEARVAPDLAAARGALARLHKPYRQVDAAELARIAGTVHHGGVAAVARPQP